MLLENLITFLIAITAIVPLSKKVEACLVKLSADKARQSHWDYLEIPRNTDETCECGKFDPDIETTPWNLFVHVKHNSTRNRTCTGTIIASNLVVTSHKCLRLDGQRMRLYEILKLKMDGPPTIAGIDQVTVSNTKVPRARSTISFEVEEIIYNPQYATSSELEKYPDNDLVLIKIAGNLLGHPGGFVPICVPFYDGVRIGNVSGYYYEQSIHDWDESPQQHVGIVLEKRHCYRHLNIKDSPEAKEVSFDKTLCFKVSNVEDHNSNVEGDPVIYTSSSTNSSSQSTAFLLGVATEIASPPSAATGYEASTGRQNVYFSSIGYLIKFIEYYADLSRNKTVWCKTPQFNLIKNSSVAFIAPPNTALKGGYVTWPWSNLEEPIKRDENQDCLCGVARSRSTGRITGGSEAPELEYSWMTYLSVPLPEKKISLCGGTIINDRVILTAAHCVVRDEKVRAGELRVAVSPSIMHVEINLHKRHGDSRGMSKTLAAVLFHPDYIYPRALNDFTYYDYDVALLILNERLEFPRGRKPGPRPICLPGAGERYRSLVGLNATVAGWGKTKPTQDGPTSNTLQELVVPIQDMSVCRRITGPKITGNFLCAGTLNRYRDAAQGDSGGPLMIQDTESGPWTQVGIVSWGFDVEPHETLTSAFYSDVQKLLPFIDYHSKRVGAKWCKSSR